MNNKNIFFIRHAESEANAGLRSVDARSIPLSENGLQQAQDLTLTFPITPDLIILSTFRRTQETAAPLIQKLHNVKTEVWDMVHEFTYLDREKNNNKTAKERESSVIEYWNRQNPFYKDGPLEESFVEFLTRAERFIDVVSKREEHTIVIFSHGQFITAVTMLKNLGKKVDTLSEEELKGLMIAFKDIHNRYPVHNATVYSWDDLKC